MQYIGKLNSLIFVIFMLIPRFDLYSSPTGCVPSSAERSKIVKTIMEQVDSGQLVEGGSLSHIVHCSEVCAGSNIRTYILSTLGKDIGDSDEYLNNLLFTDIDKWESYQKFVLENIVDKRALGGYTKSIIIDILKSVISEEKLPYKVVVLVKRSKIANALSRMDIGESAFLVVNTTEDSIIGEKYTSHAVVITRRKGTDLFTFTDTTTLEQFKAESNESFRVRRDLIKVFQDEGDILISQKIEGTSYNYWIKNPVLMKFEPKLD